MIGLGVLFIFFVISIFGIGPALLPVKLGSPLQRMTVGLAASLTIIFLLGFGIYAWNLPANTHWLLLVAPVAFAWQGRRRLAQLWGDPEVRHGALAWLAVTLWLLGWQFTVFSYSGATWQLDWYEHYDRARYFLEHGDIHHRFLGTYSLSARPPLVNVVSAAYLSLIGVTFHLYQATCVLLASLVVWPVCLLQRRFARPGETGRIGWTILLLLALPALVQNAAFTWTKLPTVFFILTGLTLLSEHAPAFPLRLAGWLSLAAGMLAHYSAGPWIVALAIAGMVRNPAGWRQVIGRQGLVIGLACGLLFATWFGWSAQHLGLGETLGSNSTVMDGTGLSWRQRLDQAAANLYYTAVPVLLRKVDYGGYTPDDPIVLLRDHYFNSVQSSALMIAGSLGVAVAGCLLWVERRQINWTGARYWGCLIGIGLVLGTVVHTEVMPFGVGQVCLLPFALLVVAWLAARLPGHPLLRGMHTLGLLSDLLLGIVLHFAVQSLWLPRWLHPDQGEYQLIYRLGHGARTNFDYRERISEPFLHDLPAALPATLLLLLAAVVLLVAGFRLPATLGRRVTKAPRPARSIPSRPERSMGGSDDALGTRA